jgi:uncharacterized lipoprotein YddW (UPF0748 family)
MRFQVKKWAAMLLCAAMLLAGCSGATREPTTPQPDFVEGRMVLTDDRSAAPTYAPESPAIDDTPALPGVTALSAEGEEPEPIITDEESTSASTATSAKRKVTTVSGEVRAVWISYLDLGPILTGKTAHQFTASVESMFDNIKEYGLNTVFVQVRPFGDALYDSEYFPWSYLCTGTEGRDPGYDPLEILVGAAKERGLRIEAWLNPYRVRTAGSTKALAASNQAKIWLNAGDGGVIRYNGVISYNPASKKAQDLIVNGALEIVRNYAVDGIHIDDYFYPHTAAAFDKTSYAAYQQGGGTASLANWRRANVETLIKKMYTAIKKEHSDVLFGVSPQSSIQNNYNAQYLDVEKIASTKGYCDYICPQIYFGFDNGTQPFAETLDAWSGMIGDSGVELYAGLAVYKCGVKDSWAGNGANEWVQSKSLLKKMVTYSRDVDHYEGFALYRYDSLFKPETAVKAHIQTEAANLKKLFET